MNRSRAETTFRRDQVLAALREHGPLTSKELKALIPRQVYVYNGQRRYFYIQTGDITNDMKWWEKRGRVVSHKTPGRQAILWAYLTDADLELPPLVTKEHPG